MEDYQDHHYDDFKKPIYEKLEQKESLDVECKDIGFAILFVLSFLSIIVWGIYNISIGKSIYVDISNKTHHNKTDTYDSFNHNNTYMYQYLIVSSIISFIFSYSIIALMRVATEKFIYAANIAVILLNVILAFVCVALGAIIQGFVFFIMAGMLTWWFYYARHYIPFAKLLLAMTIDIIKGYKSLLFVPFISIFVFALYTIFALFAIVTCIECVQRGESIGYFGIVALILIYFWTQQVARNIVHVTTAGVTGTWYFRNSMKLPRVVSTALIRSIIYNFGSICFGSLIVAIIKLLHFLINLARNNGDNSFIACCASCIVGCFEGLMEYFNEYAYSYVGIYGMTYIEAAKATWNLTKRSLFAALFNDNLIYPVLQFSGLLIALGTGIVIGLMTSSVQIGISAGLLAFSIASIILSLIHSAIVTLFVCCSENSEVIRNINPEFYDKLVEANNTINRGFMEL